MCALRNVLENVQDFKSNVGAVQLLREVLGNPPPRLSEAVELQGLREGEQA